MKRWVICKWRRPGVVNPWEVYTPEGEFSRAFATHAEAWQWVADPVGRLSYWLAQQSSS